MDGWQRYRRAGVNHKTSAELRLSQTTLMPLAKTGHMAKFSIHGNGRILHATRSERRDKGGTKEYEQL